jgi:hypothetical protein
MVKVYVVPNASLVAGKKNAVFSSTPYATCPATLGEIVNEVALTLAASTASEKVALIAGSRATPVAPFAGVVSVMASGVGSPRPLGAVPPSPQDVNTRAAAAAIRAGDGRAGRTIATPAMVARFTT